MDTKAHTFMICHLNWLSAPPGNPCRCLSLVNFNSPQQLFKTFATLLKLLNPPLQFSHSQHVLFPHLIGKIEITAREFAQLPVIALMDFHCKCTHPFLLAICLIQEVSLLQANSAPCLKLCTHLPSHLLWMLTLSLSPHLPVYSLPPLSSCSCD